MSEEYAVRVRVGAGLDERSFDATFSDAKTRAQKAAQEIAKATRTSERQTNRDRVDSARSAEKEIASAERAMIAQQRAAMRQFNSEWKRDRIEASRAERAERQQAHREELARIRAENKERRKAEQQEQAAIRASNRERDRFARRTSYRATRFLFPTPEGALGYGRRVGHDLMRGVGMDWSLSAGLQRNTANQEAAIRLSNQGYIPGQGRFENRIQAGSLRATAQGIAGQFGIAEGDILGAMSKFTDVTGDLKTAQDIIAQIALLSSATGTNIEDAASAAADMSMQLGDIPNKSEHVARLLSVAAMGGKQGAVEMKELAKTVPLIASQAAALGGDREANIGKLLAVTQTARQFGGAGNAFKAATATAGMVGALQTPARVAAFREHFKMFTGGRKDIYDSKGNLRDIQEIIKDSVIAAGSNKDRQVEFNKMWGNIRAGKAVGGFMSLAQQAGGGEAGSRAIDAQFKKFTAGLDKVEQEQLARSATDADARRAQQFQIELDKVAQNLQAELMPVLVELEPKIKQLVEGFSELVSFTANHLPSAIMLAFTGAIARAGLESVGRAMLERAIVNPMMPVTGKFGDLAMAAGTLAAAFGATTALLNLWDSHQASKGMKEAKDIGELDESYQAKLNSINRNSNLTPEQKAAQRAQAARVAEERLRWIEKNNGIPDWLPDWAQDQNHVKNRGLIQGMHEEYRAAGAAPGETETHGGKKAAIIGTVVGAAVAGPAGAAIGGSAGLTAEKIAEAIINAFSHVPNLPVKVTNAADIRSPSAPNGPQVDPNGRTPTPGNRAP